MTEQLFTADAARDILTTMLGLPLDNAAQCVQPPEPAPYCATVAITGAWVGAIRVVLSEGACRKITGAMLMVDAADCTDEDMLDAVGEIANMASGAVKSKVPGPTRTSLPTVGKGMNFRVSLREPVHLQDLAFLCDGMPMNFTVWAGTTPDYTHRNKAK